jgi:xanthine/uracil/vitamin C permease (AzgA family)
VTSTQRTFAIAASFLTLVVVVELIRRRKLREEYAFLWIFTSGTMLVLSSWYGAVEWITKLIGAVTVTTTLFLFGLLFLLLISIHFTTVLSRLTVQVRRIAQELAIAEAERRRLAPKAAPDEAVAGEEPRFESKAAG